MKISQSLYERIVNEPGDVPPETGGILGGREGIIFAHLPDAGMRSAKMCSYVPDTKALNATLRSWQKGGIVFMGMYHAHFWDVSTLSRGDKDYIEKIMGSMPAGIEQLYFPLVVMPKREIVSYSAQRVLGKVIIEKDDVIVIK